jgi:hypothetical protein
MYKDFRCLYSAKRMKSVADNLVINNAYYTCLIIHILNVSPEMNLVCVDNPSASLLVYHLETRLSNMKTVLV